jgi:hypothetical protein
MKAIKRVR